MPRAAVDIYWLPLGAGGHSVRLNGRVYEWVAARRAHRRPLDLYHAALEVRVDGARHTIEMTPIRRRDGGTRGVAYEGAVGSRLLGRWRWFRYEVRCWHDGVIPDVAAAVGSPQRVSTDLSAARRLLELVRDVPPAVWGRDELGGGEMWNSNSVVAWLLVRSGIDTADVHPPQGGRAPGWGAGVAVATMSQRSSGSDSVVDLTSLRPVADVQRRRARISL